MITLEQLDKEKKRAAKLAAKAWKKYNEMLSEYVKTCPHSRVDTDYDDWSQLYSKHCGVCGKFLGSSR